MPLKYSSVFKVLGVRLTKYQQIHPDLASAAHQMFTSLFACIFRAPLVPLNSE